MRLKNPSHRFDINARVQLSEIERKINEELYVKGVMIDREEYLTLSEDTFINMDLARRLVNSQKPLINQSTLLGHHARSRVLIVKESLRRRNRVDQA